MSKIPTLYSDYQECILDLDIYGKIVSTPQQSIEELTNALFEEFKRRKPMPTLEYKRYELSRLVSPDYRIAYNKELELQDNESLVELRNSQSSYENINFEDLSPLIPEVQEAFSYEMNITDSIRQSIIEKYDLETGEEFKPGIRQTENIVGTVEEDTSLRLSDESIDKLGVDDEEEIALGINENYEPDELNSYDSDDDEEEEFDYDSYASDDEESIDDSDEEEDIDDYDSYSSDDDEEEEDIDNSDSEDEEEDVDDYDSYSDDDDEEEEIDDYDSYSSDDDEEEEIDDSESEDDEEIDESESEDEVDDYDSYSSDDSEEEEDIDDYDSYSSDDEDEEGDVDDYDSYSSDDEEEEDADDYSSYEQDDEDEEEIDDYDSYSSDGGDEEEEIDDYSSYDSDDEEEDINGDEEEEIDDYSSYDSDDEEEDINGDNSDTTENIDSHNQSTEQTGVEDSTFIDSVLDEPDFSSYEEPVVQVQVQTPVTPAQIHNDASQPEVVDRSAEPTDIRAFLRKHPRCEYNFALKYFTKKQINDAIKIGKIIKKGNILKII